MVSLPGAGLRIIELGALGETVTIRTERKAKRREKNVDCEEITDGLLKRTFTGPEGAHTYKRNC